MCWVTLLTRLPGARTLSFTPWIHLGNMSPDPHCDLTGLSGRHGKKVPVLRDVESSSFDRGADYADVLVWNARGR